MTNEAIKNKFLKDMDKKEGYISLFEKAEL